MSLLVVGSIAYDDIETPNEKRSRVPGGSATHFCFAAGFYGNTRLVGVVGEDFQQEHIDMLEGLGVDMRGVRIAPGKTFAWGGRYEEDMNIRHTIFTHLNVFESFQPDLPEEYRDSDFVFLGNIHPDLQHHVLDQVRSPKLVAADSMNLWIEIARDSLEALLKRVDMLVVNDEEVRLLSGIHHLPAAARRVLEMGPKRLVVKRGEYGVTMFSEEGMFSVPGFPVESMVEPTGAGDSFAGGLMGYLALQDRTDEQTIRRAIVHGSAAGGFNVEGFGFDRMLTLRKAEIEERVRQFRELSNFSVE